MCVGTSIVHVNSRVGTHTHTHTHTHTPFFMGFFLMGRGIYIGISPTEQEESAACAVCLGSHAARGDYGGCDSAGVA